MHYTFVFNVNDHSSWCVLLVNDRSNEKNTKTTDFDRVLLPRSHARAVVLSIRVQNSNVMRPKAFEQTSRSKPTEGK